MTKKQKTKINAKRKLGWLARNGYINRRQFDAGMGEIKNYYK